MAWFFIYTFLHEAGHAIVGIAYGGVVESFVFWNFNAHVHIANANFTHFGLLLHIAGGVLLPVAVGIVAVCFYNRKRNSFAYQMCYTIVVISLLAVMLSWVLFPIMVLFGVLPRGEDVWRFIFVSNYHPLLISLASLLFTGALAIFANAKGIVLNPLAYYRAVRGETAETAIAKNKTYKAKPRLATIGLLFAAMAVSFLMVFVPYELPSLFNFSETVPNVKAQPYIIYSFTAEENRAHYLSLNIQGQGFVTVFSVVDSSGNWERAWSGDYIDISFGLELNEGTYMFIFDFLTDYNAIRQYYMLAGVYHEIEDEQWQKYRAIFNHASDSYAAHLSLRIF